GFFAPIANVIASCIIVTPTFKEMIMSVYYPLGMTPKEMLVCIDLLRTEAQKFEKIGQDCLTSAQEAMCLEVACERRRLADRIEHAYRNIE
ncbi:hypothetical protein ACQX8E_14690, partial [Staphylococcus aureus]